MDVLDAVFVQENAAAHTYTIHIDQMNTNACTA